MNSVVVLGVLLCVLICCDGYTLKTEYSGTTFFNGWNFYTANDPTHGYVNYLSQAQANADGLINAAPGKVLIKSDDTNVASGRGRNSIRLSTTQAWNGGLFIADIQHMPAGCGTWPAWWLVGPNWPNSGEIDIIEGVNTNTLDATSLHTSDGCAMNRSYAPFTGRWSATNCYIHATGQGNNQGCGITGGTGSYGTPFNSAGGGVYALEWTNTHIQAFFFNRNNIPGDINSNAPVPSSWGLPYAFFPFGANCNPNHFVNMNMVIDLTFCGDWAGAVFNAECPGKGTCQSFVQNNPTAFSEAYWWFNSIKVFQ